MKKLLIVLPLFATILFMNCENNTGTESQEEKHFVTISYHSEGHTEGEPPVDDNRYEIEKSERFPYFSAYIPVQFLESLKKDRCHFTGWILPEDIDSPNILIWKNLSVKVLDSYYIKPLFIFREDKDYHIELHAMWSEQ